MPGLFGLIRVNKETRLSKSSAQRAINLMANVLSHRGDYVLDTVISEAEGFAIARLSHSSAVRYPWPGSHEAGPRQGKAFLHGFFTKGDTKHLSRERLNDLPSSAGEILRDLQGQYSLVLTHWNYQSVIISVDRKASEPLFYLLQNGMVFFAPEVKALLAIFDGSMEINPEAAPNLFACGHLFGDQTLIASIKRLPGGSYLQIQENAIQRKCYWSFRPGVDVNQDAELELEAELRGLLNDSARTHLGDPRKTMIFLSGGLDSRGILAGSLSAAENNGVILNTASWGLTEDLPGSDAFIAKEIAGKFHLQHTFFQRQVVNYSEVFEETNYMTDGLSDVAAFHPYEFAIMKCIKAMGFDRVLRGDETFGWQGRVYNFQEAQAKVGLRSMRNISLYSKMLRPKYYKEWSDASESVMAQLDDDVLGMDPTDAKDYLYFTHRLQGYLHSCASYKQVLFEHRNVFLDDSILDFLLRVPWKLRTNKNLYKKAALGMFPPLNSTPFADRSGLEDWGSELKKESALQKYMQKQLNDQKSGIWEYFDRNFLLALFNSLSSSTESFLPTSFRARLRKKIISHVVPLFPRQAERLYAKRFQSAFLPHQGLLRFLVFKNWYDTFIEDKRIFSNKTTENF